MKHLNNFKNHQKVNEELGVGLALVGLGAFLLNPIIDLATGMWNKSWMKAKFDKTGEIENVPYVDKMSVDENPTFKFEGYKDKEGKHYWGIDKTTTNGEEVTFIYDDERFVKFKNKLKSEGYTDTNKYDLFGKSANYSKRTGQQNIIK